MGKVEIVFSKSAAKDYRKLPADYKTLIDIVINKLSLGVPVDVKQITGEDNVYRIHACGGAISKSRLLPSR